jgi:hypothetical protein
MQKAKQREQEFTSRVDVCAQSVYHTYSTVGIRTALRVMANGNMYGYRDIMALAASK